MRSLISDTPGSLRLRQGVILLTGAIAIVLLIGPSATGFYWTPLAVGLVYLVAALAGGRSGSYWASAVVLVGWGAAVIAVRQLSPDLDTSGLYLVGAGLGASAGMLLVRRGFVVDPVGVAGTIAAAGTLLALEPRFPSALGDARFYALLIGAVGLVNLALGALARNAPVADARP